MGHQKTIIDYLTKVGSAKIDKIYLNSDYRYARKWQKAFYNILFYMVENGILDKIDDKTYRLSENYIVENPNKNKD
jgi:hypothetical protein